MPRETIYGDPNTSTLIDVRWVKDCDVQIGLRIDPGTDTDAAFIKLFDSHGKEVAPVQDGIGYDSLWTESLTRQQINKLIQLLRKARDGAYGKDA